MRHVISILLQNESGALARVASMFSNRGFNIESLNVAPTEDESVSRLTLVTIGTDEVVRQVNRQLEKLIDVVAVADRTSTEHIERELGIYKLRVIPGASAALDQLIRERGGHILDPTPEHLTVEVTGDELELDAFADDLPAGASVLSFVRSGPLVISRGPHTLQ